MMRKSIFPAKTASHSGRLGIGLIFCMLSLTLLPLFSGCQTTGDPNKGGAFLWDEQKSKQRISSLNQKKTQVQKKYEQTQRKSNQLSNEYTQLIQRYNTTRDRYIEEESRIIRLREDITVIEQDIEKLRNNLEVKKLRLKDNEQEYQLWVFRNPDGSLFNPSDALLEANGPPVNAYIYTDHPTVVNFLGYGLGAVAGYIPFGSNIADLLGITSDSFEMGERVGLAASYAAPFRFDNAYDIIKGLGQAFIFHMASDGLKLLYTDD